MYPTGQQQRPSASANSAFPQIDSSVLIALNAHNQQQQQQQLGPFNQPGAASLLTLIANQQRLAEIQKLQQQQVPATQFVQQLQQQQLAQQREREQRERELRDRELLEQKKREQLKQQREQLQREQQKIQQIRLQQQIQSVLPTASSFQAAAAAAAAHAQPKTTYAVNGQANAAAAVAAAVQHQKSQQNAQQNRMAQINRDSAQYRNFAMNHMFQTKAEKKELTNSMLSSSPGASHQQAKVGTSVISHNQNAGTIDAERRRPSLMSNFASHSPSTSQFSLNSVKQELNSTAASQYNATQLANQLRSAAAASTSAANNLSLQHFLQMRNQQQQQEMANRTHQLLSNFQRPSPAVQLPADSAVVREKTEVRDRMDKNAEELKQLEAQIGLATKRRQQLSLLLKQRQEEMEREREAEAEHAEALRRAAENTEAMKSKIPLIDRIAAENRDTVHQVFPENIRVPPVHSGSSLARITDNYRRIAPQLIQHIISRNVRLRKKMESSAAHYDDKFASWSRRVEKAEKTPKKIARDQKSREIFEKTFPEIKRLREEKERNERHERNGGAEDSAPATKTKEEKAMERACQIPDLCYFRPARHPFRNDNIVVDVQLLRNANENLSNYVGYWTPADRATFVERIKSYGKNFQALSQFYWEKTPRDMVKYFYATKSENKYKNIFPKGKKKPPKSYKPMQLPEAREIFDHLLATCDQKDNTRKLMCAICRTNYLLAFVKIPEMSKAKQLLREKLFAEQQYRELMPICAKCHSTNKKTALRCPVGQCPGGKRRLKPSRAIPPEFAELSLDYQCFIVKKLQFHPATPKICNNCYKRITQEVESIRDGGLSNEQLDETLRHEKRTHAQPHWTPARVDALFESVAESARNWERVSATLTADNFRPSARQCRHAFGKLHDYWLIHRRRVQNETSAQRIQRAYRRIRRATERLRRAAKRRGKRRLISDSKSAIVSPKRRKPLSLASPAGSTAAAATPIHHHSIQSPDAPSSARRSASNASSVDSKREVLGSITQGTPVARQDIPLISALRPTSNPPSSRASMVSPHVQNRLPQPNEQSSTARNLEFVVKALADPDLIRVLLEELQIPHDSSDVPHAVAKALSQVTSLEFEKLIGKLRRCSIKNEGAEGTDENRPHSARSRGGTDTMLRPQRADVLKSESPLDRQSPGRPNRKTGLSAVILEADVPTCRSRAQSFQKPQRPNIHIKPEPVDEADYRTAASNGMSQRSGGMNPSLSSGIGIGGVFASPSTGGSHEGGSAGGDGGDENGRRDRRIGVNSASDSESSVSTVSSIGGIRRRRKKRSSKRFERLQILFSLDPQERVRMPTCSAYCRNPDIDYPGAGSPPAPAYEDLSD